MSREANIQSLMAMGFPRDRCEEAIRINGYVDASLDWLMKHPVGWDRPHSLDGSNTGPVSAEPTSLAGIGGWHSLGGGHSLGDGPAGEPPKPGQPQQTPAQEAEPKPKRVWTQEEKEEEVRKLQERIKQQKVEAAVQDTRSEMEAEMMRREQGKASNEAKEEWDRHQAEKAAREARKDRERNARVEAEAKERIRIAAYNREVEWNAKYGVKTETPAVAAPVEKKNYDACTIQIRLPPPLPRLQNNFQPTDTLQDVINYVQQNAPGFNFAYQVVVPGAGPKKVFSGASLSTSLVDAELVPRGAIVIEKI